MLADLHVHTNFSDGLWPPEAVVDVAVEYGVSIFAIADHDTMSGTQAASTYLAENPDLSEQVTLIPALEISTSIEGRDAHLLAYFLESLGPSLTAELDGIRERRSKRSLNTADKLNAAGYPVSAAMLEASNETVNRVNLARLLVSKGVVNTVEDAFDTLIGEGAPFFTPQDDLDLLKAIRLVREQGGVTVLAHPALYHLTDLIPMLSRNGLMGIEAFHSEQSPEQSQELISIADKLDLLVTAGSDWHQDKVHPARIGEVLYPEEYLEQFLATDPRI